MSWAYAYAFNKGADHQRCDDVCVCEHMGDYIVAAISDGAGSASCGREGAAVACDLFISQGVALFMGDLSPAELVQNIQSKIPAQERDQYSCTLLGCVAGPRGAMFVQVGDGATVVRHNARVPVGGEAEASIFRVAIAPEKSEFLNHTFFVTAADAVEHLQVRKIDEPVDEIALFSDGLQHLVIDLKDDTPHQPFFDKIFGTLCHEKGEDRRTSYWLEQTLRSEGVTKRTDDDTSIIIARRIG